MKKAILKMLQQIIRNMLLKQMKKIKSPSQNNNNNLSKEMEEIKKNQWKY